MTVMDAARVRIVEVALAAVAAALVAVMAFGFVSPSDATHD